uniref:Uncharacterized protein n=1 Tax=Anguilla anguilla TaxID=7936 RepID=A0A0E9WRE4_ANGAN
MNTKGCDCIYQKEQLEINETHSSTIQIQKCTCQIPFRTKDHSIANTRNATLAFSKKISRNTT